MSGRAIGKALFRRCPGDGQCPLVLELSEEILEAIDHLAREAATMPLCRWHTTSIAGRNRMLSQRIGKFFLFREWGYAATRCCNEWENPGVNSRSISPR